MIDKLQPELSDLKLTYLRRRWRNEVVLARDRAISNKQRALTVRVGIAVLAVFVPAFVGLEGVWPDRVAFVFSSGVALGTAVESVYQFGARWRMNRVLFNDLQYEGWAFAHNVASYAHARSSEERFAAFVVRIEQLLSQYADEYVQEFAVQRPAGSGERGGPAG